MCGQGYAEPPQAVGRGWETYIYGFRLAGGFLDQAWTRPLILRVFSAADQGAKAEREAAVQRFLVERGYPAPRPLAVETGANALARPFMIMERAPGVPMLERMAGNPVGAIMADAQVALHRLPTEGFPLPAEGPFVERQLAGFWRDVPPLGLEGVDAALRWLEEHKGMVMPEEPCLCHIDFHPLNILVDEDDQVTVIDWADGTLGDRHNDIASTLVLIRTAPVEASSLRERFAIRFGRGLLVWRYLSRYRQQLPIDRERLRYWEASRALNRWAMAGAFQCVGSADAGMKPDVGARVPTRQIGVCQRYFWQRAHD